MKEEDTAFVRTLGAILKPNLVMTIEMPQIALPPRASGCNCVSYVKKRRPDLAPYTLGAAKNWVKIADSTIPVVGGVVVTREGPVGHIAIIADIIGDTMRLEEDNYSPCSVTTTRLLSVNSTLILGYKK